MYARKQSDINKWNKIKLIEKKKNGRKLTEKTEFKEKNWMMRYVEGTYKIDM